MESLSIRPGPGRGCAQVPGGDARHGAQRGPIQRALAAFRPATVAVEIMDTDGAQQPQVVQRRTLVEQVEDQEHLCRPTTDPRMSVSSSVICSSSCSGKRLGIKRAR
jgi:hypothetical protein